MLSLFFIFPFTGCEPLHKKALLFAVHLNRQLAWIHGIFNSILPWGD
jgi:hypothetical protein